MIDSVKLENYTNQLRQAYKIYYDALLTHGEMYIEAKAHFKDKEKAKHLITILRDSLRNPQKANLGCMITLGIEATNGAYENFRGLAGEGGRAKTEDDQAFRELRKLTYANEDHEIKPLIDIISSSIRLLDDIHSNA